MGWQHLCGNQAVSSAVSLHTDLKAGSQLQVIRSQLGELWAARSDRTGWAGSEQEQQQIWLSYFWLSYFWLSYF